MRVEMKLSTAGKKHTTENVAQLVECRWMHPNIQMVIFPPIR